ncbi:MAG TPA: 4-alpha-glucanotransferase [Gemmatimonadota bacterium]|nr:4-alpha-glucanotransferase [Gemmatimonadota bacterium]
MTRAPEGGPGALDRLARLHGVQLRYRDASGAVRRSPDASVLAALRVLGAPLPAGRTPRSGEVARACEHRRRALWERTVPPVVVAPDGALPPLPLRLPGHARAIPPLRVVLEDGGEVALEARPRSPARDATVDGASFAVVRVACRPASGAPLPPGVHRLLVGGRSGEAETEAHVLSAPRRCRAPGSGPGARGDGPGARAWGVFLPLYALRTRSSAGVGSYGDLGRLGSWAAGRGASWLGTLPLLPTFLDRPFDPSPYAPVTRLFWSDLFLDPEAIVRRTGSRAAARAVEEAGFRRRREALEEAREVDYRAAHALRRSLLDRVVGELRGAPDGAGARTAGGGPAAGEGGEPLERRLPALGRWLGERPDAEAYARFRAATERRGRGWPAWEEEARDAPLRAQALRPGRDFDPAARDRWLLGAWLADRGVASVAERGRRDGFGLYLDLPLSVHGAGFDAWSRRDTFVRGMSVGAPPDAFFAEGQDWGFPPPSPHEVRRTGYAYLRACLEHAMGRASALRVDHVMGLHRLFWIPDGADARAGVYVRYRARESYALLALASHRHGTQVVGEDLGTVPSAVRAAMERHGVARTFVVPFEVSPERDPALARPPAGSVATPDTHDTWPFAGWWEGRDIQGRVELGMMDEGDAAAERVERARVREALTGWLEGAGHLPGDGRHEVRDVLAACLEALGRSAARAVVLNLEDAWLERRPQNVPGAPGAAGSWRRRAAWTLHELSGRPEVADVLRRLAAARRGGSAGTGGRADGGPSTEET